MKILFVSAILPYPLYSGGQVRIYNLLSRLGKSHEITLCTFLRQESEKQYLRDIPFCKKIVTYHRGHAWQPNYVIRSVLGSLPLLLTSYDHADYREIIARELGRDSYDIIHIEPWYVWKSLPKTDIPVVIATHNIEHEVYTEYVRRLWITPLRPGYYWDVLKLRYWEERIWRNARKLIAVSEDDAAVIRKVAGEHIPVIVVPNGVDVSSFRMKIKDESASPVFLFVGSFMWMQNRDAVEWLMKSIWPMLEKRFPGAVLRIVGRSMPSKLRKLVVNTRVTLLEHVENIEEEFHNADVLIAPIRIGGGTSFKILEAMACGLPVVTTTLGAKGLKVAHGRELVIANTDDELVEAASLLVMSPKKRSEIARNARKTIERDYAWDTIAKSLDLVWYETAKKRA